MKKLLLITLWVASATITIAQTTGKRIWLSGAARNVLFFDDYTKNAGTADTLTAPKLNSGHTMVDLAANIQPNSNTFINGMVRIRNDYGGFWGGGVTFDMRQLYLKGIIANTVRYQIGDINYKLSPYTLINPNHDLDHVFLDYSDVFTDIIDYDIFYNFNNSWRQQGAAVDFGLQFNKYVKELNFSGFVSRQNPTNFTNINDRLMAGGNATLIQGEFGQLGLNYVNMFDLVGTSDDSTQLQNPVLTLSYDLMYDKDDYKVGLMGEFGNSQTIVNNDPLAPAISDYFFDAGIGGIYKPYNIELSATLKNVGPQFFSPGAQTRRLDYSRNPLAYGRYGNNQSLRPIGIFDMLRDASLYNTTLTTGLGAFNPSYGNAQPYGDATPNRKGVIINLSQKDEENRWEVALTNGMLSEIVGSGTAELKSFNYLNAVATINIDEFFEGYDKGIKLSGSFWNESTERTSALAYEEINLDNQAFDLNLDVEVIKKGYLLAGLRTLTSVGNEFLAERNRFNEIIFYAPMVADVEETLFMTGARYEFSEKSTLSILWSSYDSKFADPLIENYNISSLALLFNMKF